MNKPKKIQKTVTRISAGVTFACLLVMTLQINFQGKNSNSALSLSALTFGLVQPAEAQELPTPSCDGGGPGAGDCQATYDENLFPGSYTVGICCADGSYACCNAGGAQCVPT